MPLLVRIKIAVFGIYINFESLGGNVNNLGQIDGVNQWNSLINNGKSGRSSLLINIDEVQHSAGLIGENGRYKIINGMILK